MQTEEKIKLELENKFPFLKDAVMIRRQRRLFADVPQDKVYEVFGYLKEQMQFVVLSAITGLDQLQNFAVIYHLSNDSGIVISLKTNISHEDPRIRSVMSFFPNAEMYERELDDLLGIKVEGLPDGRRYPLPDDWPTDEHPLRKDWRPKDA